MKRILEIAPNLHLIALNQELPGFVSFIGAWLYRGEKTFLVDTGPAATIPVLSESLEKLGVKKLDAVFLTHIHLDHAGGVGDFVAEHPGTPVVCHESGIFHLADPSRLWEGSLKTLGRTAEVYGPIRPVPRELLVDATVYREKGVKSCLTPGHASHHVSYLIGSILFGGEAGGVFMRLPGDDFYLRPATPPRFFLEKTVNSIETLISIPHELYCFGHFGATRESLTILEKHKSQLFLWLDVIAGEIRKNAGKGLEDRCMALLLKQDPLLQGWSGMEPEMRERERFFILNSIRGFAGYIGQMQTK